MQRSKGDVALTPLAAGLVALFGLTFVAAYLAGPMAAVAVGLAAVGVAAGAAWLSSRPPRPTDPGRRRVLAGMGIAGIGAVAGGTAVGRAALGRERPDPGPALSRMADGLGSHGLDLLRRGFHPERSGDLQLVLAPFNTANYPHESRSLEPRDPRSSHSLLWGYTDRIPIAVYAPGIVDGPQDRTEPVTLADLAPTTARLMGFDHAFPDGRPLPGIPEPPRPPKLVVTFVIDGGGWNALAAWPDAWPVMKRLMRRGILYRDGHVGSFPNVTASAHATIGTGAFPRTHGISGHHVRHGGGITPAYGERGAADPSYLMVPTLADLWSEETGGRAWIGEIGYQVWHLGMVGRGRGGRSEDPPVAVYWEEDRDAWLPQNPDLYRLPRSVPPRSKLGEHVRGYFGEDRGAAVEEEGGRALCCHPPIVRYQGDLVEATLESEAVGRGEATDLLYINYKAPDYAGHVYNMLSVRERIALAAVDRELGRLVDSLERRFDPGEFVLIVTADHGQCPLVEDAGGVRLDPIQLVEDIRSGLTWFPRRIVEAIRPSEIFLDRAEVSAAGVTPADIAVFLAGYRYGENIGPYIPSEAIARGRLDRREFAGVFPAAFIRGLTDDRVDAAGAGRYPEADPGIPPPGLW